MASRLSSPAATMRAKSEPPATGVSRRPGPEVVRCLSWRNEDIPIESEGLVDEGRSPVVRSEVGQDEADDDRQVVQREQGQSRSLRSRGSRQAPPDTQEGRHADRAEMSRRSTSAISERAVAHACWSKSAGEISTPNASCRATMSVTMASESSWPDVSSGRSRSL